MGELNDRASSADSRPRERERFAARRERLIARAGRTVSTETAAALAGKSNTSSFRRWAAREGLTPVEVSGGKRHTTRRWLRDDVLRALRGEPMREADSPDASFYSAPETARGMIPEHGWI